MTLRLVRALWLFGVIYASYLLHFALVRVFRRRGSPHAGRGSRRGATGST